MRFRFASREDQVLPAAERTLAAVRSLGFVGDRGAPRLKLALIELLTNAIEHGNRFEEGRSVEVAVEPAGAGPGGGAAGAEGGPARLRVSIADEGPGIEPSRLDRDVEDVPLEAKRGRGLSIVKRILGRKPSIVRDGERFAVAIEFGRDLFG